MEVEVGAAESVRKNRPLGTMSVESLTAMFIVGGGMSSRRELQRPEVEDDSQFIAAAIDKNTSETNTAADDGGLGM